MKKLFYLSFVLPLVLLSCSKKGEKQQGATQITISGQAYNLVVIGTQVWTTGNYNGPGGTSYNTDATNNVTYGKLYTLAEAKNIVLPSGWRLPTADDFKRLYTTEGGQLQYQTDYPLKPDPTIKTLMSTTGWTEPYGTNTSGFNAVGGGNEIVINGSPNNFNWLGYKGFYLTTSDYPNQPGAFVIFSIFNDSLDAYNHMGLLYANSPDQPASVRFVKDK